MKHKSLGDEPLALIGDLSYSKTDWNWDLNNLKSSKTTKIYSYY